MKNLLIIVDMQEGFRYRESEIIINRLKRIASSFDGEMVFSCFENTKGSKFERDLKWKKFRNEKDRNLLKEFRHLKARKFVHSGYTILNKQLLDFINKRRIGTVYLAGVYTDVCIIKLAMDLFDKDISVRVIGNVCASPQGENNHKYALDSLKHIIGRGNVVNL